MNLSLNMICKDEYEKIIRCLNSVKGVFNEIVIGIGDDEPEPKQMDKILDNWAKENSARIMMVPIHWTNHFGDARNEVLKRTQSPLVMWLDVDDIVEHPETIRPICKEVFEDHKNYGSIWTDYQYDEGFSLKRERIFLKDKHKWEGKEHEVAKCNEDMGQWLTDVFVVKHDLDLDSEQRKQRAIRALDICEATYIQEAKDKRPTWNGIFNYARALTSCGYLKEACPIYAESIQATIDENQKAISLIRLSNTLHALNLFDQAMNTSAMVIKHKPQWADGYIGLGFIYFALGKFPDAANLLETGLTKIVPSNVMPIDKKKYTIAPWSVLAECYLRMGEFDKAIKYAKKMPEDEKMKELIKICEKAQDELSKAETVIGVKKILEAEGDKEKLKHFSQAIPDIVKSQPALIRMRNTYNPQFEKNKLVIYCGDQGGFTWGPESVNTGIGGSEEAVINMSYCLRDLGWNVHIYNSATQTGDIDGIYYHEYFEWDPAEGADIFIAWRHPAFVDYAPEKSRVFLWLHDIQVNTYWNDTRIKRCEKIMVLSKAHQMNLESIGIGEKFWVTSNGIDPKQFNVLPKKKKHNFIYCSSPNRGLETILIYWPKIRAEFPDAVLHVYYGWDKGFQLYPHLRELKARIVKMVADNEQNGVIWHGKVGHLELAASFLECDYWLYPSWFPETSCITAMKAQASGCWPVTTDASALAETVVYGDKIHVRSLDGTDFSHEEYDFNRGMIDEKQAEEWFKTLVSRVKEGVSDEKREEMRQWALNKFPWDKVAKSWHEVFKSKEG